GWRTRLRRAREGGAEWAAPEALLHLVEVECWMGRWAVAERYAEELAEAVEQTGQRRWRGLARYAEALVAARLGQFARAEAAIDAGLAPDSDTVVRALLLSVRGFAALSGGDLSGADRHLTEAAELVARIGIREGARFAFDGDRIE